MKKASSPLQLRTPGKWGRPVRTYPTFRIRPRAKPATTNARTQPAR